MPSAAASPTPYPFVNTVLQLLLKNAQSVLDTFFIGLYLHGSLAIGDFDPGHSDIDFVVVTTRELPLKLIADLEAMHARIKDSGLEWVNKLEGSYISKKALLLYNPVNAPRPRINEKKFIVDREKIDSVINRYILRESGVAVAGPPIKPLIAPVSPDELREAVVQVIREAWTPRLNDREWLVPPGDQPYLIVTCCRALYTMKFGTVTSKPVSARWALTALDKQWTSLIESAMAWHYGVPHGDIEKSLQFIRYTMKQIGASSS
jgi:predicted nucleotidyltransferase